MVEEWEEEEALAAVTVAAVTAAEEAAVAVAVIVAALVDTAATLVAEEVMGEALAPTREEDMETAQVDVEVGLTEMIKKVIAG